MPRAALRPCTAPGCATLVPRGSCPEHQRKRSGSSSKLYGRRWQMVRRIHLSKNPLCVHCEQEKRIIPATQVDHIIPHRGNLALMYDESNLQSLCHSHHSRKTALEDRGFGNTPALSANPKA